MSGYQIQPLGEGTRRQASPVQRELAISSTPLLELSSAAVLPVTTWGMTAIAFQPPALILDLDLAIYGASLATTFLNHVNKSVKRDK